MRRGFKADAERTSLQLRADMGAKESERVDAKDFARHLGIDVRSAGDLIDVGKLEEIERAQPGAFSACTFELPDRRVIVFNPLSTAARIQSDIAHEVGHVVLRHSVKDVQQVGEFSFFSCDQEEEQEATWLAGCLLLPRPLVLGAARRGMNAGQIAAAFGVSTQMANFRLRTTGALIQTRRW